MAGKKTTLRNYARKYAAVPPDKPSVHLSFRLAADLVEALNTAANTQRISRNLLVEAALHERFVDQERPAVKPEAADVLG